MSAREKAHQLLDRLPESEIKPTVEFLTERQEHFERQLMRPGSRAPRVGLGRSRDGRSAAETATEPIARRPA
jgi:hypothetical protein